VLRHVIRRIRANWPRAAIEAGADIEAANG
jgi:hypothetical protein